MKLLYVTFVDWGDRSSGSSVRPHRMYEAFEALGCEIWLLHSCQSRLRERRRRVREVLRALSAGAKPDICYVEPPSGPFFCHLDLKLLKRLWGMGVPIALFYRDAYWRYADWWGVKGLKRLVLSYMHKRDLRVFRRCCSVVYFPTESMRRLFAGEGFKKSGVLPPGCIEKGQNDRTLCGRAVYAGGVSEHYGTHLLLEAFELLNSGKKPRPLTLVCREKEWQTFESPYKARPWLTVLHIFGEELKSVYDRADVGIIPVRRDAYMDFALPVKLFEYLSYGLPVIATPCAELSAFIARYGCGAVCGESAVELARAVERFYENADERKNMIEGACRAARENLWTERAKTVIGDLTGQHPC